MKQAFRALRLGSGASPPPEQPSRTNSLSAECPHQPRTESAGSLKPEHPLEDLSPPRQQSPSDSPRQDNNNHLDSSSSFSSADSQHQSSISSKSTTKSTSLEGKSIPPSFICPVSMEIMADPVILATGHTYDRTSIERWFAQGHKTCPVTGMRLRHVELTPNFALRNAILEWASENQISLPDRIAIPPKDPVFSWDKDREGNILPGHDEIVWALQTDGNQALFTASADKTIRAWDVDSRRCTHVLEDHTRPVLSLALTDGLLFSGSYDCTIKAWNTETMSRVSTLNGHTDAVRTLAIATIHNTTDNNSDNSNTTTTTTTTKKRLFSGSYDGTLRVWDIPSLTCISTLTGHSGPVRTLVCCNGLVFSGSYDKTVRVWNASTLECIAVLQGHTSAVRALAASSTGNVVFSGSDDATIRAWDTISLRCLGVLEGHEDNVRVLAVGNGHLLSGSWDKTVRVWDTATLECIKVLEGHTEAVLALAVGDEFVVSGSYDATLRFWDVATWRCVRRCEGHRDAVRVLATGEGGKVYSGSYDGSVGIW